MAKQNAIANKAYSLLVDTTVKATTFDTNVTAAAVTLSGTTLAASGSNADIDITITPKGTGTEILSNLSTGAVTSSSTGHLASTGAGTLGQVLTAQGGATVPNWQTNAGGNLGTGWATWGGAGNYFDDTTLGSFSILRPGTGYILGNPVSWTAPLNVAGLTAGSTWYIYIDNTGSPNLTNVRTDALYQNNIVLFECLRDETSPTNNQITVRENHPYQFPWESSNYQHHVVNTVIDNFANGANITLNGTQGIQINGTDFLDDHGVTTTIPDSGGIAVTWNKYYTDAGGKWSLQNSTNTFTGFWNNAGTVTALGAGRFAVYTLYASKDNLTTTTPLYFAVLNTADFPNQGQATTAIANGTIAQATNELAALEIVQLGYIVYRQSTAAITVVTISKTTLRQTLSTGGTNTAALVTTNTSAFNGILSAADTNVQSALDTIDNWGASTTAHGVLLGAGTGTPIVSTAVGSATQVLTSNGAGNDPTWQAPTGGGGLTWTAITADQTAAVNNGYVCNKAGLLTLTLPASAAVGSEIAVTGINTALGWKVLANAGQTIYFGTSTSTVAGNLASVNTRDSVHLVCVVANTDWNVISSIGNITIA